MESPLLLGDFDEAVGNPAVELQEEEIQGVESHTDRTSVDLCHMKEQLDE